MLATDSPSQLAVVPPRIHPAALCRSLSKQIIVANNRNIQFINAQGCHPAVSVKEAFSVASFPSWNNVDVFTRAVLCARPASMLSHDIVYELCEAGFS